MEVSDQLHAPAVYPRGKIPGTHWIASRVSPRRDMNAVKNPAPGGNRIPAVQPVARHYADSNTFHFYCFYSVFTILVSSISIFYIILGGGTDV
jgi:hypothetical protein